MPQIGGYVVVVEEGPTAGEYEFIADTGHPIAGQKVEIDGLVYVVDDVCFREDTEARTATRRSFARVRVRPVGQGDRVTPPDLDKPTVLPFVPPPAGGRSTAILPPSLVAVLVVAGYAEQKVSYRVCTRRLAQLRRCGANWVSVRPRELWRLSRLAKRYMFEAATLAAELRDEELIWPSCALAPAVEPELRPWSVLQELHQGSSPPARSARPALRLVSGGPARGIGA